MSLYNLPTVWQQWQHWILVSAQKVSGHKASKNDNMGINVSTQKVSVQKFSSQLVVPCCHFWLLYGRKHFGWKHFGPDSRYRFYWYLKYSKTSGNESLALFLNNHITGLSDGPAVRQRWQHAVFPAVPALHFHTSLLYNARQCGSNDYDRHDSVIAR